MRELQYYKEETGYETKMEEIEERTECARRGKKRGVNMRRSERNGGVERRGEAKKEEKREQKAKRETKER